MKIDIKEASVEASMTFGNTVDMKISDDSAAMIHLMSLLTNLYNDPELAVIREYYTNALDAMVEAGKANIPVDVYLPTNDNPLFVVKDYGIGMSAEDIEKIYSQYGASTKRDTNDQVGAFGLGCKSALTIATQFTISSIKDSLKTVAIISKTETGLNTVDILPSRKTDEDNGVTVTIPVPNVRLFNDKVANFFKFSDSSRVRINGHAPHSVLDSAEELSTGLSGVRVLVDLVGTYDSPTFKVIMGNVPYTVALDQINSSISRAKLNFSTYNSKRSVYFVVNIGDVDLTPSREGLRYTDKTKERLDELVVAYVESLQKTAQEDIDSIDDRAEVHGVIRKWMPVLNTRPKWRGIDVPQGVKTSTDFASVKRNLTQESSDHKNRPNAILAVEGKYTIVDNTNMDEYRKVSMYLAPYMRSVGLSNHEFLFTSDASTIVDPWIIENKNIDFVKADKIVEIGREVRKKERAEAAKLRQRVTKVKYHVLDLKTGGLSFMAFDKIPANTPYMHLDEFWGQPLSEPQGREFFTGKKNADNSYVNPTFWTKVASAISPFTEADSVIFVGGNRKVSALLPRVKGTYSLEKDYVKAMEKSFKAVPDVVQDLASIKDTDLEYFVIAVNHHSVGDKIRDENLLRLINPKQEDLDSFQTLTQYEKSLAIIRPRNRDATIPRTSDALDALYDKYPLIESIQLLRIDAKSMDHVVTYINAVHDQSLTAAP